MDKVFKLFRIGAHQGTLDDTRQVPDAPESYRLVAIDENYANTNEILAKVQIARTSRVFTKPIQELYKKEWLDKFSKEDVAYIGFLYAVESEKNFDLIPYFPRKTNSQSNHISLLAILYTAFLILSNIAGGKVMQISSFHIPAVLVFFPLTYIFDDVLTEVYGFKVSRRIIWLGFIANIIVAFGSFAVIKLPPSSLWHDQASFEAVFQLSPRILVASSIAYLVSEFFNSIILAKLKIVTGGKHLWIRILSSTSVGAAIDSLIFCFLAFYGVLPLAVISKMAVIQYIFKVSYETLALPVTYQICRYLKKTDAIDVYDYHTDFNPFSIRT